MLGTILFCQNLVFPLGLAEGNSLFHLEAAGRGGHVGFTLAGSEFNYMEKRTFDFIQEHF